MNKILLLIKLFLVISLISCGSLYSDDDGYNAFPGYDDSEDDISFVGTWNATEIELENGVQTIIFYKNSSYQIYTQVGNFTLEGSGVYEVKNDTLYTRLTELMYSSMSEDDYVLKKFTYEISSDSLYLKGSGGYTTGYYRGY